MTNKLRIWRYIKYYKFNSIFIKNFIIILLPTILTLISISISGYAYYNSNMKEKISAANINTLSKIRDMIDMIMIETDKTSVRLSSDNDIGLFLSNSKVDFFDFEHTQRAQNISKSIGVSTITSDYIDSIYVFSEKSSYIISSIYGGSELNTFFDSEWYDNIYHKMNGTSCVIPREVTKPFANNKSLFLSSFRLAPLYEQKKDGVVIVNIDVQRLKGLINSVNNKAIEDIYIIDENGNILYNTDLSIVNKKIDTVDIFKGISLDSTTRSFVEDINGTKKVISIIDSNHNNWKFVSIIPLWQYEELTINLRRFMIFSVIMSIFVAIGVAFFISIKVFEPINNIFSVLEHPQDWEHLTNINERDRINEFKYIASNIIKSFDKNRKMEEELAERLILLRKAQNVALQSQINPHFLYNTLETINWKAMGLTGGENEVSFMVSMLSELLRYSLETQNNLITIRDEIEHAKRYVNIQKIRYKDKFDVVWSIDEGILDYKIVKLVLQPLIENAIYHGIKPKKENGIIKIQGIIKSSNIIIVVSDSGIGMAYEKVCEINNNMEENYIKEDLHIGISNVNQRIKLIFGRDYGLSIKSELNRGTEVKIMIPLVE